MTASCVFFFDYTPCAIPRKGLRSGFFENNLSDIVGTLAEHEKQKCPITKEAISKAVTDLYGGWSEIDEKSVAFISAVLDNQRFGEIYAAIHENEQNTKSVLIAFQDKYPGVLDDGNIDSVIEKAGKKNESKVSVRKTLEMLKNSRQRKNIKSEKNRTNG